MSGQPLEVTPWFGGDAKTLLALDGTDKVAYSWGAIQGVPDEPKTIAHLLIWHNCDKSIWRTDPKKIQELIDDYVGWHPAGVGLHTLVSVDPLHLEPSLLWPDCCGMHGFIRDGAWIPA